MRRRLAAVFAWCCALAAVIALAPRSAGALGSPRAVTTTAPVKGIAVTLANANEITDARAMVIANELFPMLRTRLHANAVSLSFPFFQDGSTASDPGRAAMTPSPQRLMAITAVARRYGLDVQWRPYLYEGDLRYASHNWIKPAAPLEWMASYWAFLKPYLVAASLADVSSFSIACEQTSMLKYLSAWTSIVHRARSLYGGVLLYSQQHQPQLSIPLTAPGYDAYEPIRLASPAAVSAAAFTAGFEHNLRLPAMQSTPADLTVEELGITATRHAYLAPANDTFGPGVHVDRPVQTDWFEGACNAFWHLHLAGIYFYAIAFNRYRPGESDATSVGGWLGTPTETAIARCFARPAPHGAEARSAAPHGITWDAADAVEPSGGHPTAITCPSAAFCVVVDEGGDARTESSGAWGPPVHLTGSSLTGVSCGSPTFCVAVDDAGGAFSFDGTTWTEDAGVDPTGLTAVACAPGTTSCVAVDDAGDALRDTGGAWTRPVGVAASPLTAVACPTATTCRAVSDAGLVYTDAAMWSSGVRVGQGALTSLGCPTPTTCLAGGADGRLYRTTGGPWRTLVGDVAGGVTSIACEDAVTCEALGAPGSVAVGASVVGVAHDVFPRDEGTAVGCAPSGPCTAVSFGGEAAVDAATWSAPRPIDAAPGALTAVSCASPTSCVAVDDDGDATTWDGTTWSPPAPTGLDSATGVSCVASFCAAVSDDGKAVIEDGGVWSRPRLVDAASALTAVSCASPGSCVATDASNRVLTYDGAGWSRPSTRGADSHELRGYTAVSCARTTLCVAVDTWGHALVLDDGHAALTQADAAYVPLTGVSCPTATWCVAVDDQGRAVTYSSTARRPWSEPVDIDAHRLTAVSCASTTYCLAVDDDGGTVVYDGATWSPVATSVPLFGVLSDVACVGETTCAVVSPTSAALGS